ncbi:MAG TPA: hypothetical protein VJ985_04510 [Gammaproteobacteria bacterium]|nr:hypothetical protein [Gammaproteobacteria bacterium]
MSTEALRQWVADRTGLTAIWQHPNAPRPARPYASLQVINSARVALPYTTPPDAEGTVDVQAQREVTISIQIHEAADTADPRAALQRAESLRDSLELPGVRDYLAANGWALRDTELLADTPELVDTAWEPRATFDARFGHTVTQSDDAGLIESAEVTGTVESGDASQTEETTLE